MQHVMHTCIEDMRSLNDRLVPSVDLTLNKMCTDMSDPSPQYFYERFLEMLTGIAHEMSLKPRDTRLRCLHVGLWGRACRCRREWSEVEKKSQPSADTMDVASDIPWTREQRLRRVKMSEKDWSDAERRIVEIDNRVEDWVSPPCTALDRCHFTLWMSMRTLAGLVGLPMGKDDVKKMQSRTVMGEDALTEDDLKRIAYHVRRIEETRMKIESGDWKADWDM